MKTKFLSVTQKIILLNRATNKEAEARDFLLDELDRLGSRIKTLEMHLGNLVNAATKQNARNLPILLDEYLVDSKL